MTRNSIDRRDSNQRIRCYGCHRPVTQCFCDRIPAINNQTAVLILQHRRERLHPFNTARILRRSLLNSQLFADHIERLADALAARAISDGVGLLYPGEGSRLLSELSAAQRPKQLVILDGTWHHTKTLVREIPQLQSLPKYSLAPSQPSRYRIRREPNALFLSTLEATVAALRCLEPETHGFDLLLSAFDGMVENQLPFPKAANVWRRNHRRIRDSLHIPSVLRTHPERVVAVYGEMTPGTAHDRAVLDPVGQKTESSRAPVFWVAERLVTGERFEQAIKSPMIFPSSFFEHLELPANSFTTAVTKEAFLKAWEAFLRPDDTLMFYCSHVPKLLKGIGGVERPSLFLKGIQFDKGKKNGALDQLLNSLGIVTGTSNCSGRAGKRLANTIALANHLIASAKIC